MATFSLPDFLRDIVSVFKVRAKQKGIWFIYEDLSDLPIFVKGDEKRLRQVLINLLGNAIKFTKEGGVAFKVGYHYNVIRFQIEDTGIGIPSEQLETIFAPFQQIGNYYDKVEGTGLGLTISKRLVKMMNGELGVKSTLGQRSTFWVNINLPVIEGWQAKDEDLPPTVVGFEGPPCKILIADDVEENRSILTSFLQPLGFELMEAVDGQNALDKAIVFQPDIILMDIRMPKINGLEVTRRIRQIPDLANITIIAISASAFSEDKETAIQAGCNEFIAKPVQLQILLQHLEALVDITWIYQGGTTLPTTSSAINLPEIRLPQEVADHLFVLAQQGYVKGLKLYVDEIEQMDKQYQPLVVELRKLLKVYQLGKIRELVEPYKNRY